MVKHQFQRRNLSLIEKIKLAYLSKQTIEKVALENLSKGGKKTGIGTSVDTAFELSKIAGVGRTTITSYNTVLEKGTKDIIQKMENGNVSIFSAYGLTKKKSEAKKTTPKLKTTSKTTLVTKMYKTIEQAEVDLKLGKIDGILILKEASQIDSCTAGQKKKFGFCMVG